MSCNLQNGTFNSNLPVSDPRSQMPGFQPAPDRYIFFQPWQDGRLWSRSRFGGSEMSCSMLTEDFMATGRWDTGPYALGMAGTLRITGTTRDSGGSPLGNCIVQGFLTATDAFVGQVTSDPGGYFELPTTFVGRQHYLVAYKAGSPDIAGTTLNTLVPS